MSQELPSPPPPEVSFLADPGQNPPAETDEAKTPPDFGNMGWRFCQQPIRKVSHAMYECRSLFALLLHSTLLLAMAPLTVRSLLT